MRELSIPTRETNPIHNDVLENTIILHIDQSKRDSTTKRKIYSLGPSFLQTERIEIELDRFLKCLPK